MIKKLFRLIQIKRYEIRAQRIQETELNKALKQWGITRY